MFSFNDNWLRVTSDPLPSVEADEDNSYTRALRRALTPDPEWQQQVSDSRVMFEETSQSIADRSTDSVVNEGSSKGGFVGGMSEDRIAIATHEIESHHSSHSVVGSSRKIPDIPDLSLEHSCTTFGDISSNKSNASSDMSMATEHANNHGYCCHSFHYNETWSVHSGSFTASAYSEDRTDASPVLTFAPAGASIDFINSDSTVSGLTTATSFATDTVTNSVPDYGSVRYNAVSTRNSEVEVAEKSDKELILGELLLIEEDFIAEDSVLNELEATDVSYEEEDVHCVEYVEETAPKDVSVDHMKEQPMEDGNEACRMLGDVSNEGATQYSSVPKYLMAGQHPREDGIKTSFIKKLLPTQRFFARTSRSCNNEYADNTLILQTNNHAQREIDEFEMICASSAAAVLNAKEDISLVPTKEAVIESSAPPRSDATVSRKDDATREGLPLVTAEEAVIERREPQRRNEHIAKRFSFLHSRSNATHSAKAVSTNEDLPLITVQEAVMESSEHDRNNARARSNATVSIEDDGTTENVPFVFAEEAVMENAGPEITNNEHITKQSSVANVLSKATVTTKHMITEEDTPLVFAEEATIESSGPHRSTELTTKQMPITHVRSNATDSTKDISVFTMRSVDSNHMEPTGGEKARFFSFGSANAGAFTFADSSLLLYEEVEVDEEVIGSRGGYVHDRDHIDEALNVEIVEEDYVHSPHLKNEQKEQATTLLHNKLNIPPRLSSLSVITNDDVMPVQDVNSTISDDAHELQLVENNPAPQKGKWNGMRMRLKRWKTGQSAVGEE